MTIREAVFRSLALCTQRPGQGLVELPLSAASADLSSHELVDAAEHHGLDALLHAHIRAARLKVDSSVLARLRARHVQHSHAFAVRTRVMSNVLSAMDRSRVRLLVLKGAALGPLVYADPRLRPMRDVDLLVHEDDLRRALDVLVRGGFTHAGPPPGPRHHHLRGLSKTVDGATVTIELHRRMLARTPFLPSLGYHDLAPASQPIEIGGVVTRAPAREDLLWHAYAHGFVINALWPGTLRLISLADVVHATETWIDLLEWDRLRRHYPRLVRALALVSCLVPWSSNVVARLGECAAFAEWDVRPLPVTLGWASALRADVLWPGEWWFRMRYGISGLPGWMWYRSVGHPATFVASAVHSSVIRFSKRIRPDTAPSADLQ